MSNVDPAEIERFEALAARWWDPSGEMAPLHHINDVRLDFVERGCGGLRGKRVVDVGCGGGILTEAMAARGADALGIDLAQASLEVGRLHALETGVSVEYRMVSAEQLADEAEGQYDVVTCLEMLEHVPDPGSIVRACARLVRPGGHLFFSTINRTPKAWALSIVAAEYLLGLLPRGTHTYAQYLRPSELVDLLRESGLMARELRGLHYNPLLKTASLTRSLDVNYLLHGQRPNTIP